MTSTYEVRNEISRFLASDLPEVLCLTGSWGVGKTYTWDLELKKAQKSGRLKRDRYAYVSLFGVNSLEDLRYAVFENTVGKDQIARGPDVNSLQTSVQWLEKYARRFAYLANALPHGKEILQGSKSAFLVVRDQIVCIDDLERAGKNLDVKDVLGLASFLKEQRNCKVVLLLNQEKLAEEALADFNAQLEKVVDISLVYAPTVAEAVEIGVDAAAPAAELLTGHCLSLGIRNIRVIKKIERLAAQLHDLLEPYDKDVLKQAIHTAALFGWTRYQPTEAPTAEFLKDYNSVRSFVRREEEETDQEKTWKEQLVAYGFTGVDEFDQPIVEGIWRGHFDSLAVNKEAARMSLVVEDRRREGSFHQAWEQLHGTWLDAETVLTDMFEAFKGSVAVISPMNLNGTVLFFKEMGRDAQARELIAYYMQHRIETRGFFDLNQYPFRDEVVDPDVIEAFNERLQTFIDARAPTEVLVDMARNRGWNPDDIELLEKLQVDDFRAMFLEAEGLNLRHLVTAALQFRRMGGIEESTRQMSLRAEEALRQIGQMSEINARRVRQFGVALDAPAEMPVEQGQQL